MRHIIVHLLRGEAKEAHEAITRDLVEKFDAFPIHDRIVPHLTLKRWFELNEAGMESVYKALDIFTKHHNQSDYKLGGFGHFGEGVIYVDVKPSLEMSAAARDLMAAMHDIEGMTFDEYDDIEGDFHATVAMRALKPFDFEQTWNYLNTTEGMDFDMKFDNIAILKKEEDKWVVDRVWELPNMIS
jgi:2'-5' RNA ligase